MKNYCGQIAVYVLSSVIFGCGGGGGGDTGPVAQTPTTPSDSKIRTVKDGDTWNFSVTGKETSTNTPVTGTARIVVAGTQNNGRGVNCKKAAFTLTLQNDKGVQQVFTDSQFFSQTADGSMYDCGKTNSSGVFVGINNSNGLVLQETSPLQVGQTQSAVTTYDDGTWQDCTVKVDGYDSVSTGQGAVGAFRLVSSCSNSDGSSNTGTEWISPTLYSVKLSAVIDTLTVEITLKDSQLSP